MSPYDNPLPWPVVGIAAAVMIALLVMYDPPPKGCAETFDQNKCDPGQTLEIVDMGDRKSIVCRCPKSQTADTPGSPSILPASAPSR